MFDAIHLLATLPFPRIDPNLLEIGPFAIRWYALAYVAGIVLGWWYAARLIKTERLWAPGKPPISTTQLDDLVLWIVLGIILGGRLGYALFYKPVMYAQLFTGDTLFVGECGRTDLPGSNPREMHHSLFKVLAAVPDSAAVWPGHDYGPRPSSTMGAERRENYVLAPRSLEEFVAFMAEP